MSYTTTPKKLFKGGPKIEISGGDKRKKKKRGKKIGKKMSTCQAVVVIELENRLKLYPCKCIGT